MPPAHPTDLDSARQIIIDRSEPVTESGCWIWTRGRAKSGYGCIRLCGQRFAHRASYVAFKGQIPDGLHVCHSCDVRECVNPSHLWLGTPLENIRDCIKKGRARKVPRRGERHHKAKLTELDVLSIRARCAAGSATRLDLAREYGVDKTLIGFIVNRKIWAHI
jgi:hypothetical protein